jgi:hypothetical protein
VPPAAGPRCPRCHRPLAAWRLAHCVYCGESIPAELKQGFAEPEALKWVDRPQLPADVHKKLEMMRVVAPLEAKKSPRSLVTIVGAVSVPLFIGIFYLTWTLLRRLSPISATLILGAGVMVIGYLVWTFMKARK